MRVIEKIEKGYYSLEEFTEDQRSYIIALVKMSYNEGIDDGKENVKDILWKTLRCENDL